MRNPYTVTSEEPMYLQKYFDQLNSSQLGNSLKPKNQSGPVEAKQVLNSTKRKPKRRMQAT